MENLKFSEEVMLVETFRSIEFMECPESDM